MIILIIIIMIIIISTYNNSINPIRDKLKKVTRRHKGGGGLIGPLPSTFDTLHPIY